MGDFRLDPTFERDLLSSSELGNVILELTEKTADRARELAPDDPNTPGSSVARGIDASVDRTARGWIGRVNGWDFKTGWFEFGTSRVRARRMLGRALEETVGPVEKDANP